MIIISDNFSDSKTLLRKEAKFREGNDVTPDEELEDEVWLLFYYLGFEKLNIGRECEVKFGKKETELSTKKVDVIAQSNEIRVYVECTTQQNDTSKIKEWSSEVDSIRKFESGNSETESKNIVFIYCNNGTLSEPDRDRLSKKGIVYLNYAIIEYFNELKAQYSRLAYFQLISFLCRGQQIKSMSNDELTIPAIKTKYGSKSYTYLFGIHPSTLIPLSTVPHRKLDYEDDLNQNYQRLIKKAKINAIKKFIKEKRGVFPTNIIISIESDKHDFKPFGKSMNDIQHGTLTLPRQYQSVNIIDGQHRLYAYDGLEQGSKDLIYVLAFNRMALEDQIATFIDINEKQTKVSPSLLWDLYPSILEKNNIKFRVSTLVKKLNEKSSSSLAGIIQYDSAPYSDKEPKLTLESVCTALKTEKILEDITSSMELLRIPNRNDSVCFALISFWFEVIKEEATEHWNRRDQTLNLFRSNQGFGALIKVFSEVIKELYKNDAFDSLRTDDFLTIKESFRKYINPVTKAVSKLKSKEEIKNWKRIGEGGKQQLFIDFIRIIRKEDTKFGDSIIREDIDPELTEILSLLNSNSEHITIEAKEAFFADTKRLKTQGELVENKEEAIKGIIKTVVAFSNYLGGKIIVGLEDNTWDVKGIDHTDLKLKRNWDTLKQAISQKISSCTDGVNPLPVIRKVVHKGKTLLIIEVKRLSNKALENASLASMDGDCYKRENADTIKIKGTNIGSYCIEVLKERSEMDSVENEEEVS